MENIFITLSKLLFQKVRMTTQEAKKYRLYQLDKDYERIIDAILNDKKSVTFSKKEVDRWKKEKAAYEEKDRVLRQTADLNNKGISLEKEGKIEEAIKVYEENIAIGYPATHSFNRLMVIYRRQKDYENEERIILEAISLFEAENEKRKNSAISLPENQKYVNEIINAHESNQNYRPNGAKYFIYTPYPTNQYKDRLEKCRRLQCR